MLGIIWGTFAISLLLAIGQGFRQANEESFLDVAEGSLIIWTHYTTKSYQGFAANRPIAIDLNTAQELKKLPSIKQLSPVLQTVERTSLQYESNSRRAEVYGVDSNVKELAAIKPANDGSRFFTPSEVRDGRYVIFLGAEINRALFGNHPSLGKTLFFANHPFTVIGVMDKNTDDSVLRDGRTAYIPYTIASRIWNTDEARAIWIEPKQLGQTPLLQREITRFLARKMHFDPSDTVIQSWDSSETRKMFIDFFFIIQIFLGFCGCLALFVGAISVANTMYLVIRERTAEIGLYMAIGAQPQQILLQFLFEATVIVLLAGLIGLSFAAAIIFILQLLPLPTWLGTPTLSLGVLLSIFLTLTCVSLLAGFFPALRASRLAPVNALGYK
jgi:putative ABC transport system permease protein